MSFVSSLDCSGDGDVVFIVDSSGSVGHDNFEKMRTFVYDCLRYMHIGNSRYQAALILYSDNAWIEYNLTTYRKEEDILNATRRVRYLYGATNTADALRVMRTTVFKDGNGNRGGVQDIAILITDGISNVNTRATLEEARRAKNEGITIAGVGVNLQSRRDLQELQDIVSEPHSRFAHELLEFDDLENFAVRFMYELCAGDDGILITRSENKGVYRCCFKFVYKVLTA